MIAHKAPNGTKYLLVGSEDQEAQRFYAIDPDAVVALRLESFPIVGVPNHLEYLRIDIAGQADAIFIQGKSEIDSVLGHFGLRVETFTKGRLSPK